MPTQHFKCNSCGMVEERPGWWIQEGGPCKHRTQYACPGQMSQVFDWSVDALFGARWQQRMQQRCLCASLRYLRCTRCGFVRKEKGWRSGGKECEHRDRHGCLGEMQCPPEFSSTDSTVHDPLPEWERRMQEDCLCCRSPGIASLAGETLKFQVRDYWTIAEVKAKMQQLCKKVRADQVCLSFGGTILPDAGLVKHFHINKDSPPMSWAERDPELTKWLKLVQEDWQAIHRAPETACKSPEVMLTVMSRCRDAIFFTHAELLHNVGFLRQICGMRGFDTTDWPSPLGCLWSTTISNWQ